MGVWRKGRAAAAVALAFASAACASSRMTSLDGEWIGTAVARAGKADTALSGHRLRFDGDRFRITRDGELLFGGRYEAHPGATPPKIDFQQTESKALAGTWRGIYTLDGDRLTICDNAYGMEKPRPKRFEDCAAPGYVIFRFTRAK